MKIAVLAGGYSPERDVSLVSGGLIAAALRRKGHSVALADIYLGIGETEDIESLFTVEDSFRWEIGDREPDLKSLREKSGNGDALVGKNVIKLCRAADVVFIGLHGGMGENGQVQALLDCYGIRYTGTGYIGSLLAMDKEISKSMMRQAGVRVPGGMTVYPDTGAAEIERRVGYPCVIKPCSCGSSVGVSIAGNREELERGLALAFEYEDRILVEEKAEGREMTVGILCGSPLPPVEIVPKQGFYDYKNKYQDGMTDERCPPDITDEEWRDMSDEAMRAALALHIDVQTYCRVDFILTDKGPVCLEVNTLPGMTPLSLLPREANAVGIDYDELCQIIVNSAFDK